MPKRRFVEMGCAAVLLAVAGPLWAAGAAVAVPPSTAPRQPETPPAILAGHV